MKLTFIRSHNEVMRLGAKCILVKFSVEIYSHFWPAHYTKGALFVPEGHPYTKRKSTLGTVYEKHFGMCPPTHTHTHGYSVLQIQYFEELTYNKLSSSVAF